MERTDDPDNLDDADEPLAGTAADDVSAGISVSGAGGEEVGDAGGDESGLDQIVDAAGRMGWGRPGRPDDRYGGR